MGGCNVMIYKKFIFGHSDDQMYFSDIFDLHPQLLKMLQSHKGKLGVL